MNTVCWPYEHYADLVCEQCVIYHISTVCWLYEYGAVLWQCELGVCRLYEHCTFWVVSLPCFSTKIGMGLQHWFSRCRVPDILPSRITAIWGKYGHVPWKILLLQQIHFLCQWNLVEVTRPSQSWGQHGQPCCWRYRRIEISSICLSVCRWYFLIPSGGVHRYLSTGTICRLSAACGCCVRPTCRR